MIILGLMFMIIPLSVRAAEEPRYEVSLKFYKVPQSMQDSQNIAADWFNSEYMYNWENEIDQNSIVNPGDYIIVAPVIKLIGGKEANAKTFSLYIDYDNLVFEKVDIYINNSQEDFYKQPFPEVTNGWDISVTCDKYMRFYVSDFGYEENIVYDNGMDYPIAFVALKVNDTVSLGNLYSFHFYYKNAQIPSSGSIEDNTIVETPLKFNNYYLRIGGGVTHSSKVTTPENIIASTRMKEIKVYEINRNNTEDYVIGIEPFTNLGDFVQSFPNYDDYLKVYDRNGKLLTNNSSLIGTGMQLKLVKDGEVKDTLRIIVRGDLNYDGKITENDAQAILNGILGRFYLDRYQELAADIDKDEELLIVDCAMLSEYINETINSIN